MRSSIEFFLSFFLFLRTRSSHGDSPLRLAEKQKELDDRSEALEKMRKKFLASEQMVIGKDNEVIKFRSEVRPVGHFVLLCD